MTATRQLELRDEFVLSSEAELRAHVGDTHERIWAKASTRLSSPMRDFIALSPFLAVASHDGHGRSDISPRGDAPGFVDVVDDRTLLVPERPGNRRYDTIRNILETGAISLLFLIPGVADTLRVNGTARVTRDPDLVGGFAVNGRCPAMILVVSVAEAYGHCSKAIRRGAIRRDDYKVRAHEAPSLADMMTAHLPVKADELQELDEIIERDVIRNVY